MAAFFAMSWVLLYAFFVATITRWFHVAGSDVRADLQRAKAAKAGKAA